MHLNDGTREKVKELKERIQIKFSKNCAEESTKFIFSAEQLSKNWRKNFNTYPKRLKV